MKTFMIVLLIISSVALIAAVLLSPAKSSGLGSIEGGAETLFGKKKAKGLEGILQKVIVGSGVVFMLSAFIYSILN